MRLSPPSKNCFISRYILLVGSSGIIKECENQSNGFYLKKWPLTTVLSDIQKPDPGKAILIKLFSLTLFPMGYFGSPILHGGGAKLPTPPRIFPHASNVTKLGQNV